MSYVTLSMHRRPTITELSIGSRWGKTYAQFSKLADLGVMSLVEHVASALSQLDFRV
jgi:hypothetical protein